MAAESFRASLAIAERVAKSDPGNAAWQHTLSLSQDRMGDVLLDQRDPAALESYLASLAIVERLAKSDPSNARRQRNLLLSQERIGNLLRDMRDVPAWLESYRA